MVARTFGRLTSLESLTGTPVKSNFASVLFVFFVPFVVNFNHKEPKGHKQGTQRTQGIGNFWR